MSDPGLVLLDEPTSGLDLGGREELVERLDELARTPDAPPMVLVTHHVEEIPPSFTDMLALRSGHVLAQGPIASTLGPELLGECFGLPLSLSRHDDGRWSARRRSL
jgi:iron complex transport system ATP-binding protein